MLGWIKNMRKQKKHDNALEWIVQHPEKLCINKVKFMAKEVKLYKPNGDLLSEIDVLAYDGELYHVEYKSSVKHFKTAIKQLTNQRDFIRQFYKGKIHSVFMHRTKDKDLIKKGWKN